MAKNTHLDVGPVDLLTLVLRLLHLEHVLVEVLLQLLVGEVDAELRVVCLCVMCLCISGHA